MEVTKLITTQIKKLSLIQVLAVLSVFLSPLLFLPFQKPQTAYANTFSSKCNMVVSDENIGATVEAIVLNVREDPSLFSPVIGKLKWGTKITVHDEQSGWAKMVSSSGIQGWVYEYYITKNVPVSHPTQSVIAGPPTTGKIAIFNEKESTRISGVETTVPFIAPNSQEPLKGKTIVLDPGYGGMDAGTTSIVGTHEKSLTLPTAQDVKRKLEYVNPNVIMTQTNDTTASDPPGNVSYKIQNILNISESYLNKPTTYVFGAGRNNADIDANIFDCSSWVREVFAQAGINLGPLTETTTNTLAVEGTAVPSVSDLKPGDLVFWNTYKHNGHVGIYLGNGTAIACNSGKGVSLINMSSSHYAPKQSTTMRRIIN